jgi:hypothetical protein
MTTYTDKTSFVNPDDPTEICGFIDWQATELAPLYNHIPEPYALDYDGPPLSSLLHRPSLEEVEAHFGSDAASKKKAEQLLAKMSLVALFRRLVQKTNPRLFKAMEFRETSAFDLLLFARNLFIDGEATYLALLQEQRECWAELPAAQAAGSPPFPIPISREEAATIQADCEGAAAAMELMKEAQRRAGKRYFRMKGLVDHEQMILEYAKNEDEVRAWNGAWPFDD